MLNTTADQHNDPKGASLDQVLVAERTVIEAQRAVRGVDPSPATRVGLALSGGGIRSASFALGVLQGLARKNKLADIDYLSTVSGGGYIGASLTWFHYLQRDSKPATFPFGVKGEARREARAQSKGQTAAASTVDNTAFIRQHGEYLTPSKRFTSVSLIAVALRNVLVTFSVYFALVVAALLWIRQHDEAIKAYFPRAWVRQTFAESLIPAVLLFALFFLLSLVLAFATGLLPKLRPSNRFLYQLRVNSQRAIGLILVWSFAALVIGSIPHVHRALANAFAEGFAIAGTTLAGLAGVVFEFIKQQRPNIQKNWPKLSLVILWITVAALIYGMLLAGYALSFALDPGAEASRLPWYFLGYSLLVGGLINSNMFSMSRMYRDRLMEAFMPDPVAVQCRKWRPASRADVAFVQDVCTEADPGPYHLINTNVVLTGTDYANYRGRGGDSFMIAPRFSGSEATGWHETSTLCGGSLSLATAVAISGAAVNPNAACGGRGPTRNRLASFLLALFNIRLGYWIRNPHAGARGGRLARWWWPNLIYPGIRQGLLGTGQHVRAGFIELTDGGHFDNTGIYELVRRRVDCIILSLASADPDYGFDDLADVIERVRVDFGVYIDFSTKLEGAIPGSSDAPASSGIASALKLSKSGHVDAKLHYPDGTLGHLIVLKSTITDRMPMDVYRYAARNAAFPNESTADQFFDERQFEAYRESGYAAARGMLQDNNRANWF